MTSYRIYYFKSEHFSRFSWKDVPVRAELETTHVELMTVNAESVDQVFSMMQGEKWSPNGEARLLIQAKGLSHTSMSVGDVLEDLNTGTFYACRSVGWTEI